MSQQQWRNQGSCPKHTHTHTHTHARARACTHFLRVYFFERVFLTLLSVLLVIFGIAFDTHRSTHPHTHTHTYTHAVETSICGCMSAVKRKVDCAWLCGPDRWPRNRHVNAHAPKGFVEPWPRCMYSKAETQDRKRMPWVPYACQIN